MTWSLFTDTKTVTHHLKAGDLSITLKRTELLKTTLDSSGYLVTPDEPDKTVKDFTDPTNKNVFDIGEDELIVPGSKFSARMRVENNSDVAFGYWIEIICTDKESGENLAKQLKVTVNAKESYVADGLTVGSKDSYIGVLDVGTGEEFSVTVEFENKNADIEDGVPGSANDIAQGENVKFDLVVYAIQVVTNTSP